MILLRALVCTFVMFLVAGAWVGVVVILVALVVVLLPVAAAAWWFDGLLKRVRAMRAWARRI